jgi:hypothetical protein
MIVADSDCQNRPDLARRERRRLQALVGPARREQESTRHPSEPIAPAPRLGEHDRKR